MTNTEREQLLNRAHELKNRYESLMAMEQTPVIQDIIGEYMAESDKLFALTHEKREYLYNFKSGGWNSEWAYTSNQAYAQAMERWGDDTKLAVDPQSFRVSTQSDYANLLSLFH